jgi:hypothetical protein
MNTEIKIKEAVLKNQALLALAGTVLNQMQEEYLTHGDEWADITDTNAAAVEVLKKLNMIRVIRFNDGKHYGQIRT